MAGRGTNSIEAFNKQAIKEIQAAIRNLPKEFSLTKKRNILKKGLDPFINSVIVKAPQKTGDLKLSIGTKTFRNNPNYVFGGVITKKKIKVGGSVGTEEVDGFYAKFLEYGYRQVAWAKKGQTIRKGSFSKTQIQQVAPKPFLRPAWEEAKNRVRKGTIKLADERGKAYLKKVEKK